MVTERCHADVSESGRAPNVCLRTYGNETAVYCLHVVLLARQGYWDFQEAGYKCGLLNFCGKVCVA